jgi:hypothetical protein
MATSGARRQWQLCIGESSPLTVADGSGLACRVDELGTLKLSSVLMMPLT